MKYVMTVQLETTKNGIRQLQCELDRVQNSYPNVRKIEVDTLPFGEGELVKVKILSIARESLENEAYTKALKRIWNDKFQRFMLGCKVYEWGEVRITCG